MSTDGMFTTQISTTQPEAIFNQLALASAILAQNAQSVSRVQVSGHAQNAARTDSSETIKRLVVAETRFLEQWRAAWKASMDEARPAGVSHTLPSFHDTTA